MREISTYRANIRKCLFIKKEKYEKFKTDVNNNKERIRGYNYVMFKSSALLVFLLMTILVVFTFFFSDLQGGRTVYSISAVSGGLMYFFAVFFLKKRTITL
jgi:hypothetical protein